MQTERGEKREFFDEFGLEVVQSDVEIGSTYPLFAMITKFLSEEPGRVQVELNFNIVANVTVDDEERLKILKERAFESGIFVSTVVSKEPKIEVNCQTIIFGKKQALNA